MKVSIHVCHLTVYQLFVLDSFMSSFTYAFHYVLSLHFDLDYITILCFPKMHYYVCLAVNEGSCIVLILYGKCI
jgi:hypothetical protein